MGFLKSFLASLLAIFVSLFLLFLFVLILVVSSSRESEPFVRDGTVLEVRMGNTLMELPPSDPFTMLFMDPSREPVTLRGLRANLEKAAADDRIEGVWFKMNNITAPWTNLISLRDEMIAFREESGKFIYVSTDDIGFNEQSYFLATAADSIFSPPETFFEFDGFFIQAVFFKDLLEKIGVQAEIFRAGDYKSAVEPFFRRDLSRENEEQLQAIIDNVADTFLAAVGERTGMTREELDNILNESPILTSRGAFEAGLVDLLTYPDDVEKRLENRVVENGNKELRTITYQRYNRVKKSTAGVKETDTKDKIAVIYATGNIMPEFDSESIFPSTDENITYRNFSESLEDALEDDNVKAIVLRITSPGGAGSTSDLIWNKIREASDEKPIIASMGSVAASGGYYIAMAADTIVASSQTITGSIGVFGLVMNMQELFNDKLGVHFDAVTSHDHSLWISPDKPMSDAARRHYQGFIDEFYEVFLERVTLSRDMTVDQVREVAGGRVWTGIQAHEVGLVDVVGELPAALAIAAEKAGIEEYKIEIYPKPKSIFDLFSGSAQAQVRKIFQPQLKELEYLDPMIQIITNDPRAVIARIPFDHKIY
jgi:protease IV